MCRTPLGAAAQVPVTAHVAEQHVGGGEVSSPPHSPPLLTATVRHCPRCLELWLQVHNVSVGAAAMSQVPKTTHVMLHRGWGESPPPPRSPPLLIATSRHLQLPQMPRAGVTTYGTFGFLHAHSCA